MTLEQAFSMMADVIQVGKYLQWESQVGRDLAWKIMDAVHKGKYADNSGFWVQADEAMHVLRDSQEGKEKV